MDIKEYYYTPQSYETAGIDPFKDHVGQYLKRQRTVPVSRTMDQFSRHVCFTFSDPLLRYFRDELDKIKKPYEVALKYGFRGYSKGGKNGIFFVRESDGGLITSIDRLVDVHTDALRADLDFENKDMTSLRKVKIVWHKPSGERIVGLYNTSNNRIFFLDFANY